MKKVFITEFSHDLEGLLFESVENLQEMGALFEFVMDVKDLNVGDLIMFCGDFYMFKGRTEDSDIKFFMEIFAQTYDSFSEEKKKEWDEESKSYNQEKGIPPYKWVHLIQMFESEELIRNLYDSCEEAFMEVLDITYEDGEGDWLFGVFENHIKGFKKMSIKNKIQALKMKMKEYDKIRASYEISNEDKDGFH